jgi:hypothetical protein
MNEIFRNYVKILQENAKKTKIAQADHAEHTETSFKETNPRMDSLSIEQINKLYDTKPSLPKDMEYKKNIMEDAHPESQVLCPSYDKLNGLVENEIEGQAIRMRIVNKIPDGLSTQRRYAKQDFVYSLVSLANELDRQGNAELLDLADVCLLQLSGSPIEKKAFWPAVLGIGAVIGLIYAKEHLALRSQGLIQDMGIAIENIDAILNESETIGVGYTYSPAFIKYMQMLKNKLDTLRAAALKVQPILERRDIPLDRLELKDAIAKTKSSDTAAEVQAMTEFKKVVDNITPAITKATETLSKPGIEQRIVQHKGMITGLLDDIGLHGGYGLIGTKFNDLKGVLTTLAKDIVEFHNQFPTDSIVQDYQARLEQPSLLSGTPTAEAPTTTETPSVSPDIDRMMESITKHPEQLRKMIEDMLAGKK